MFERSKPDALALWRWFRTRSAFVQTLLIVPIICALVLTLLVGNIGLAVMGTAYAISAAAVGWVGGVIGVILVKAGIIIAKSDKNRPGI